MVEYVILGGSGWVGTAFRQYLTQAGKSFRSVSRSELDYGNPRTLAGFLKSEEAKFVINTAGYTGKPNVDACEKDKTNCLDGNSILPGRVADGCELAGIPWGHISSGCIYTGTRPDGSGFTEDDAPNFSFRQNNCSFYSGTKALGEEVLLGRPNVYIWRPRIPFSNEDGPRNYLSKLMRYNRLIDAENSISDLNELARVCVECWEKRAPFGIYNATNPGTITTRKAVDLILESGVCQKDFEFFSDESEFMQKAAVAPRSNCVLSTEKLKSAGITMTPIEEAIRRALANWQPEKKS